MTHTAASSSAWAFPPFDPDAFAAELRAAVCGGVSFDPVIRGIHASDASHYQTVPRAVATPLDADDVVAALRVAHKHRIPTTPRGGGTSLSGQTFGPGLVLDLSRHLDRVLEVNPAQRWARVQPGVVRDRLNAQLKPHRLHFAPDPATGNRATVGGMIGNNTSGTRSILYGKTIDHVLECTVALADGTVLTLAPQSDEQWQQLAAGTTREADLYRGVKNLVLENQDEIRARYPKILRRVTGYNLDEFVDGAGYTGPIGPRREHNQGRRTWNLANLIVGSEGTLAVLLEAKIRLTPLPHATAICVIHFHDLLESLRAVPLVNTYQPAAVELLDGVVLREAKVNAATRDMAYFIEGNPGAVLITELFGDTPQDVHTRIHDLARKLREQNVGYAHPIHTDAKGQHDVWETRKLGLGLISNIKGRAKGIEFVEDAAVPVEVLHEYIAKMMRLCDRLGVKYGMYAHASVGVLHFRPMLNVHEASDRQRMKQIADQAFAWVCAYGGAFAGEHGDGIVRGEFVPRYFGPKLYEAFRRLKGLFDPDNLMNPGKVVDAPSMHDPSVLRFGPNYRVADVPAHYHHRDQGGFVLAVEQCNGVGACRKVGEGTMCPSYMATRDEKDTTRARANALRLAMSGQLQLAGTGSDALAALASDEVHAVLDLCLSCKACRSECPNAVDMAKLKADALQIRHDRKGTPIGYRFIGGTPAAAARLAGFMAPLIAAVQKLPGYRYLFEKLTRIDRRRPLPPFARRTLHTLLRKRPPQAEGFSPGFPSPAPGTSPGTAPGSAPGSAPGAAPTPRPPVVLFNDTYATYMESHVGLAAVNLLEALGYRVILANAGCCQRPRISKGLLRAAKTHGTKTLQNLDVFAKQGLPILCLEPSCASSLADDLPDLCDDEATGRRVAAAVKMIDVFLHEQGHHLTTDAKEILIHGHCHQKALFGTAAMEHLLGAAVAHAGAEGKCSEAGAGCCGMAGSFGYEHFEVSRQVAEERLLPAARAAVARGATIVASGISCRHQLHDLAGIHAKHFVEVVKPAQPARPS